MILYSEHFEREVLQELGVLLDKLKMADTGSVKYNITSERIVALKENVPELSSLNFKNKEEAKQCGKLIFKRLFMSIDLEALLSIKLVRQLVATAIFPLLKDDDDIDDVIKSLSMEELFENVWNNINSMYSVLNRAAVMRGEKEIDWYAALDKALEKIAISVAIKETIELGNVALNTHLSEVCKRFENVDAVYEEVNKMFLKENIVIDIINEIIRFCVENQEKVIIELDFISYLLSKHDKFVRDYKISRLFRI